jgi:hypothetical protein
MVMVITKAKHLDGTQARSALSLKQTPHHSAYYSRMAALLLKYTNP